jgi:hypothetical protein
MAFYGLRDATPAEHFWYRISIGYAVHSDPVEAVVLSICEVIERDSIAITWQQRLALPLVAGRYLSGRAQELIDWGRRHFISTFLFDATTDMAVLTVFCLLVAPHAARSAQLVSCATGGTMGATAEKALLDGCVTWELKHPCGPCFACYARRRVQHDRDSWASAVLGWAYAADQAWGPGGYLPHHARLAAALTRDVINRPAVHHEGLMADEVTTIGLPTGGFRARPAIASPGCDRCEPAMPPARPDWLREVSARARADVGAPPQMVQVADGRDRMLAAP